MSRNCIRHPLAGLVTVRTLGELGSSAMLPFVVIWAHRDAGLGGAAAGVLFIVQAAGEFGAGLAGGALADRFGHWRLLLFSAAGMALGYGLLAVAKAPPAAIALFLLAGIFESAFHPTIGALVGDMFGEEQLVHAFGVVLVGANAGRIAGPLIGAAAALVSLPLVFAAAGGLLTGALLAVVALIPHDVPSQPDEGEAEVPPGTLRAFITDRRLAVLVLAGGLLSITFAWWGIRPLRIPGYRHRGAPHGRRRNDLRPDGLGLRHHPRRPSSPRFVPGRPVDHRRHRHRHRTHQWPRLRRRHQRRNSLGSRRDPVRSRRHRNQTRRRARLSRTSCAARAGIVLAQTDAARKRPSGA